MHAIRIHAFGGPEVLRLEEVPDPQPGPGEVRIDVRAVGVNPVETYVRSGAYGARPLPLTPGSDAAGVVDAVGEGVTRFRPGDRVYTAQTRTGAYAQKTVAPETHVHPLPDGVSFAQGAAINIPYATAYRSLVGRARVRAGECLLVHGASGGVGVAAVQIGRALGLDVAGTAGSDDGAALVAREGAHRVHRHDQDGYLDAAVAATPGGRGFDVVLEMAAHINLGRDLTALAPGGRVVVVGSRGPVEINARDTMGRDAAILGMLLFNTPADELAGIHRALFAGLENGSLRPVVGRELPLADAPEAHAAVLRPGAQGKIVLIP